MGMMSRVKGVSLCMFHYFFLILCICRGEHRGLDQGKSK